MSDLSAAELAATTNWHLYDGPVATEDLWRVIFPVILLAISLTLPGALCFLCLSRSRIVPYAPPHYGGGASYDRNRSYGGNVTHGSVMEK